MHLSWVTRLDDMKLRQQGRRLRKCLCRRGLRGTYVARPGSRVATVERPRATSSAGGTRTAVAHGRLPAVDWTTYIPSTVTGVVGLAGIGGALWQAKRAREAAADDSKANREAASNDLQANIKAAAEQLVTGINAEDRRAHIAAKRRIYASVLAALNEVTIAATAYRVARGIDESDEERKGAVARQTKAQEGMFQALGELMLIAPPEVAGNAIALQNVLVQFMIASHAGPPFQGPEMRAVAGVRDALLRSMRVDLGESVNLPEQADMA
jgi:hypothetical protein